MALFDYLENIEHTNFLTGTQWFTCHDIMVLRHSGNKSESNFYTTTMF